MRLNLGGPVSGHLMLQEKEIQICQEVYDVPSGSGGSFKA